MVHDSRWQAAAERDNGNTQRLSSYLIYRAQEEEHSQVSHIFLQLNSFTLDLHVPLLNYQTPH